MVLLIFFRIFKIWQNFAPAPAITAIHLRQTRFIDRDRTDLQAPSVPVVSNVTAAPVTTVDEVRTTLATQVCAPVLWERSMRWALDAGHRKFLEPAPGTILAGLFRKIDSEAEVVAVSRPDEVAGALESIGAP